MTSVERVCEFVDEPGKPSKERGSSDLSGVAP
jgi:hypothetical protein